MRKTDSPDRIQYLLRGIPRELWVDAQVLAGNEGRTMRQVLIASVKRYARKAQLRKEHRRHVNKRKDSHDEITSLDH